MFSENKLHKCPHINLLKTKFKISNIRFMKSYPPKIINELFTLSAYLKPPLGISPSQYADYNAIPS